MDQVEHGRRPGDLLEGQSVALRGGSQVGRFEVTSMDLTSRFSPRAASFSPTLESCPLASFPSTEPVGGVRES